MDQLKTVKHEIERIEDKDELQIQIKIEGDPKHIDIKQEIDTRESVSSDVKPQMHFKGGINVAAKPFQCNHCDTSYTWRHALDKHTMSKHPGEKPHKCSHCESCFVTKSDLIKHQKIHKAENLHQCCNCQQYFNCKQYLGQHQRNTCSASGSRCRKSCQK
ncbi:unnamed protein product, partial [Meganyctiphanes norvegica]